MNPAKAAKEAHINTQEFALLSQEEQVSRLAILGHAALREYGIEADSLDPLSHAENTTFSLSASEGRFCLRISRPGYHTRAQIESEIIFLGALMDEGFRIPPPWQRRIVTASVSEVPEARACVLLGWLEGEFANPTYSVDQSRRLGRTMASMHMFARSWSPPPEFSRHTMFAFESNPEEAPDSMAAKEDRRLVAKVRAETGELFTRLPRDPEWWGILHGDLHHDNVLFENEFVNVIDFDDTQWGFWLADFAAALAYVMPYGHYPQARDAMLAGYAEVYPLPPRTEELLDVFLQARLASLAAWAMSRSDLPDFRATARPWVAGLCARIRRLRG